MTLVYCRRVCFSYLLHIWR